MGWSTRAWLILFLSFSFSGQHSSAHISLRTVSYWISFTIILTVTSNELIDFSIIQLTKIVSFCMSNFWTNFIFIPRKFERHLELPIAMYSFLIIEIIHVLLLCTMNAACFCRLNILWNSPISSSNLLVVFLILVYFI